MADEDTIQPGTAEARALDTLVDILKAANTPDQWEAQSILLRRLALQGDVVGSRVPAPKNITEIGGYLNLLADLQQPEMRAQTLAGILGVAGPNPPLGWFATSPPLSMVTLPNDRPEGDAQPSIPLSFSVRSDFAEALEAALDGLHDQGCQVPFLSTSTLLPQAGPGGSAPEDVLPYLGRVLSIVPAAALRDPATDPIVLARAQGSGDPFEVMARVIAPGSVAVPPANFDAQQCDSTSCTPVAQNNVSYVPLAPALATAGFYPANPLPAPTSNASQDWSRFTNVTGLVAGVTKLGDELAFLHNASQIQGSAFASRLHWTWNGTTFAA